MLKNELQELEEAVFIQGNLLNDAARAGFQIKCNQICKAWHNAAFSNAPEYTLERYFSYHLEGISKLSDTLSSLPDTEQFRELQNGLLFLIDHLKDYYAKYLHDDTPAPTAFQARLNSNLTKRVDLVLRQLQAAILNPSLKTCLLNWLKEILEKRDSIRYSFRSLSYVELLISRFELIDFQGNRAEAELTTLLLQSNFNHLAFLAYQQQTVRCRMDQATSGSEQLLLLRRLKAELMSSPQERNIVYDSRWPSFKTMMTEWIQEQIWLAEVTNKNLPESQHDITPSKLPLKLSVAHLACLIRLFFEENVFSTENRSLIFKSFAANCQTKRQTAISADSLSKEFYSINQHTAARVRDLLQKMVQRINRDFFPVMVVISTTILLYQEIH